MEQDSLEKQISSTNKKCISFPLYLEKIFNVRKVHYKMFDHEKCTPPSITDLKPTYTPFQLKEHLEEPFSGNIFI